MWCSLKDLDTEQHIALISNTLPPSPLPTSSQLAEAIAPSLASKQPGSEQFLANLVADAALAVMPKNPKDFNVDSVRVVKVLGGGLDASRVVRGMVFGREPEGSSFSRGHKMLNVDADRSRCGEKGDKSQSRGLHLWFGYFTDRD